MPDCQTVHRLVHEITVLLLTLGPDGDQYVGEWKDGKRHRRLPHCPSSGYFDNCYYTWASGDQYVGEWKDSEEHGQGTYTFADGRKYIGEWKDDKKHGQGTYTWADGNQYVGGYKDDKKHGFSTYTWADGSSAKEMWKNGESLNDICKALGLRAGTEKFAECVLKLIN